MVQAKLLSGGFIRTSDSSDGKYKANVKDGDQLVIKDEGMHKPDRFNAGEEKLNIGVEIIGKEDMGMLIWTLNKTTESDLAHAYGTDTKDWIGKLVNITKNPKGKKKGWYGEPVE